MVRSVFRLIEFIQGKNGFLLRQEYFLYIFDALLMFIVMATLNWIHPAEITELYHRRLRNSTAEYPLQDTREKYTGIEHDTAKGAISNTQEV
jgi:hypothetical protein